MRTKEEAEVQFANEMTTGLEKHSIIVGDESVNKTELFFRSFTVFASFESSGSTSRKRRSQNNETESNQKLSLYCDIGYGYYCQFGKRCKDLDKNLSDQKQADNVANKSRIDINESYKLVLFRTMPLKAKLYA